MRNRDEKARELAKLVLEIKVKDFEQLRRALPEWVPMPTWIQIRELARELASEGDQLDLGKRSCLHGSTLAGSCRSSSCSRLGCSMQGADSAAGDTRPERRCYGLRWQSRS